MLDLVWQIVSTPEREHQSVVFLAFLMHPHCIQNRQCTVNQSECAEVHVDVPLYVLLLHYKRWKWITITTSLSELTLMGLDRTVSRHFQSSLVFASASKYRTTRVCNKIRVTMTTTFLCKKLHPTDRNQYSDGKRQISPGRGSTRGHFCSSRQIPEAKSSHFF